MRDLLDALQSWYTGQCDGEWEHQYGLTIETLDNPGWAVEIDLTGTNLSAASFPKTVEERSPTDWIHCSAENGSFKGYGGPGNLVEILRHFLTWVEGESIE